MPKQRADAFAPPTGDDDARPEAATAAQVLRELTDIGLGRRAFTATDRQGNPVENSASVPERIRALELLAKYHKLTGTAAQSTGQPVNIVDDIAGRSASNADGDVDGGGKKGDG